MTQTVRFCPVPYSLFPVFSPIPFSRLWQNYHAPPDGIEAYLVLYVVSISARIFQSSSASSDRPFIPTPDSWNFSLPGTEEVSDSSGREGRSQAWRDSPSAQRDSAPKLWGPQTTKNIWAESPRGCIVWPNRSQKGNSG